ncbi:hypothetical protein, partial [Enterococcus thailandicus]|uniref:hypothetical protein n=1 Tax=Enterococcus thailandicus TaxID=417368 RepID=UPI0034DCFCE2
KQSISVKSQSTLTVMRFRLIELFYREFLKTTHKNKNKKNIVYFVSVNNSSSLTDRQQPNKK